MTGAGETKGRLPGTGGRRLREHEASRGIQEGGGGDAQAQIPVRPVALGDEGALAKESSRRILDLLPWQAGAAGDLGHRPGASVQRRPHDERGGR